MSEFEITFLGTSASMPTGQRGLPATMVQFEGRRFLVDCGEGTQRQMMLHGGLKAPDAVFITHYHPDHTLGLPGLLASLKMMEHDKEIYVYGPPGVEGLLALCQRAGGFPKFVVFNTLLPGQSVVFDAMTVTAYRTDHDIASQGYIFEEDDRPGRFDAERAIELGVKPGPDFKRLQEGHAIKVGNPIGYVLPNEVIGLDRPGRKVVITGDTRPCKQTVWAAENVDLLIHEATFTDANRERAQKVGHSTIYQATEIAHLAKVGQLALTHFSPRENLNVIRMECGGALVARDGDIISIPVK